MRSQVSARERVSPVSEQCEPLSGEEASHLPRHFGYPRPVRRFAPFQSLGENRPVGLVGGTRASRPIQRPGLKQVHPAGRCVQTRDECCGLTGATEHPSCEKPGIEARFDSGRGRARGMRGPDSGHCRAEDMIAFAGLTNCLAIICRSCYPPPWRTIDMEET